MKCIYCGAELTGENFCRNCGADVSIQKRIIRISNLLYNRGLEKASVRDLSGAESLLRQSLKFNKENIDARNLLGLCYFETGEVVSALVEWVISSNLKPENNLARTYLEDLQSNKNRLDTINSTIRKYNQSIEYCRGGHEDMAVMQLKKVISQNPKMVKAYQLLSLLYMKYGEWERAGRLLRKAAQIDNTNTTTLRYMTWVRGEKGKHPFARKKNEDHDQGDERSLRYVSGNDIVIAPTTFRDSSTIATIINIFLGILLGAAIVWFLTVPAVRQSANDKANKSVTDANTSLATVTATVQDLQDQVDSANSAKEEADKEKDDANDRVDGYKDLLKVADLYVLGDQTKTVEALGKLNADDYDGEGKTLYDDITNMVGDALFNQYYNQGTSAYVNKDYAGAASALEQAVNSDPNAKAANYKEALYYLGFAYYFQGDYTKADEVFTKYADKYPNDAATVQPYMNGGAQNQGQAGGDGQSASQGQASVDTDSVPSSGSDQGGQAYSDTPQSSGTDTSQSSGSDITVYGTGSGQSAQQQIVWTDPVTGQGYDMYGNPVYAQ